MYLLWFPVHLVKLLWLVESSKSNLIPFTGSAFCEWWKVQVYRSRNLGWSHSRRRWEVSAYFNKSITGARAWKERYWLALVKKKNVEHFMCVCVLNSLFECSCTYKSNFLYFFPSIFLSIMFNSNSDHLGQWRWPWNHFLQQQWALPVERAHLSVRSEPECGYSSHCTKSTTGDIWDCDCAVLCYWCQWNPVHGRPHPLWRLCGSGRWGQI